MKVMRSPSGDGAEPAQTPDSIRQRSRAADQDEDSPILWTLAGLGLVLLYTLMLILFRWSAD